MDDKINNQNPWRCCYTLFWLLFLFTFFNWPEAISFKFQPTNIQTNNKLRPFFRQKYTLYSLPIPTNIFIKTKLKCIKNIFGRLTFCVQWCACMYNTYNTYLNVYILIKHTPTFRFRNTKVLTNKRTHKKHTHRISHQHTHTQQL